MELDLESATATLVLSSLLSFLDEHLFIRKEPFWGLEPYFEVRKACPTKRVEPTLRGAARRTW